MQCDGALGAHGSAPTQRGDAPSALPTVNRFCMAVLYGGHGYGGRFAAKNGVSQRELTALNWLKRRFRPGQTGSISASRSREPSVNPCSREADRRPRRRLCTQRLGALFPRLFRLCVAVGVWETVHKLSTSPLYAASRRVWMLTAWAELISTLYAS
jgi:hypothetical protein